MIAKKKKMKSFHLRHRKAGVDMVKVPEESCLLLTRLGLHAIHTALATLDGRVGWELAEAMGPA